MALILLFSNQSAQISLSSKIFKIHIYLVTSREESGGKIEHGRFYTKECHELGWAETHHRDQHRYGWDSFLWQLRRLLQRYPEVSSQQRRKLLEYLQVWQYCRFQLRGWRHPDDHRILGWPRSDSGLILLFSSFKADEDAEDSNLCWNHLSCPGRPDVGWFPPSFLSSRDLTWYACFGLLGLPGINNSSIPSRSMDFR